MKIAVASGKGGTGKTTIATSLALSLVGLGEIGYWDCDVEAPDGHIFLKPAFSRKVQAVINIPQIKEDLCLACGKCVEVCQFHALVNIGTKILILSQLCHGCGSCTWNCPHQAITEIPRPIGMIESGLTDEGIHFSRGLLTISEPMSTPVIRQLKHENKKEGEGESIVILDAPPGASCSVVETLHGADFAILVTEPTPFGLHDLRQVAEVTKKMNIPTGVIINRQQTSYPPLDEFCDHFELPVLLRIPFEFAIAEGVAQGETLVKMHPEFIIHFQNIFETIKLAGIDNITGKGSA
ncbi:MAG TPA: ATP-binding protein [Anaerolineaceae bacterium]|nr:ATP-binding protein [Anaerolineaceae bacterium]HPN52614.1 ATP-binding protein [Anaerolineaceae bacterium]